MNTIKKYTVVTNTAEYGRERFTYLGLTSKEEAKRVHLQVQSMPEHCIVDVIEKGLSDE